MVYGDGSAPCATCRVDLMASNEDAAQVYMQTRRQVITAGEGRVIDIDIQAVKTVMDLYEIRNQRECMEKVRTTFFHFLKEE
jgi:hypothetical protein